MSGFGGADVPKPSSPHAGKILGGSWPASSESTWWEYGRKLAAEARRLAGQEDAQAEIQRLILADGQTGAFIDAAAAVNLARSETLYRRFRTYLAESGVAHQIGGGLWTAKLHMAESVATAEAAITAAKADLEPKIVAAQAAARADIAQKLQETLQKLIDGAIKQGQTEVQASAAEGAANIAAHVTTLASHTPAAAPMSPAGQPGTSTAVGADHHRPASPGTVRPAGHGVFGDSEAAVPEGEQQTATSEPATTQTTANYRPTDQRPGTPTQNAASSKPTPTSSSPGTSAPSSSGSGGGSGSGAGSSLGSLLQSGSSSGSSPASSTGGSSPGSSGANSGLGSSPGSLGDSGANSGLGQPGDTSALSSAGATSGAGLGGARGIGLGLGAVEGAAQTATGALGAAPAAATSAVTTGITAGTSAAAQAASAAGASSAATGGAPLGAGAPMTMMPASAAGAGAVSTVAASTPAPAGNLPPPAASASPPQSPSQPAPPSGPAAGQEPSRTAAAGAALAPVMHQPSPIHDVGAGGATGEALFTQAVDAGRQVLTALLAQTVGYVPIDYAVALTWERTGGVSAWLATSEGASYLPPGVRVPAEVRLAVTDPVAGQRLWAATAAVGGGNPLEVLVQQAQAREQVSPGAQVLALASSRTLGEVQDWAGMVGARAVHVDPRSVGAAEHPGQHRCAAAMPWEWRQAQAFTERDRLQVAARHMRMAATAGHLGGGAAEQVMDLFEERKPIDASLWEAVAKQRYLALIDYESAVRTVGLTGPETARLLAVARATEVVECLRRFDTAEGCADLLYAARLAGAPLNPAAAVV